MPRLQKFNLIFGQNDVVKLEMNKLRMHVIRPSKDGSIAATLYEFPDSNHALDAYNFFKRNKDKIKKLIIQND